MNPSELPQLAAQSYRSITFITTYQCTAACRECCFESSPTLKSDRLDFATMSRVIDEALGTLPNLELVVFSGGECFMLKDELFKTIAYASSKGLKTRCVSNGYWGKTPSAAKKIVEKLVKAGIYEMNLSTGLEHQEWVPLSSISNACVAMLAAGIPTYVTVEKDTESSACWKEAHADPELSRLLRDHPNAFSLSINSWMPFHATAEKRATIHGQMKSDCDQLFSNLVINPYRQISACCGLTFEHIPEMNLGRFGEVSIAQAIDEVSTDFLKIWIHKEGPAEIVKKVGSVEDQQKIEQTVHICQACAVMHQSPTIRKAIQEKYLEYVPDVVGRFVMEAKLRQLACGTAKKITNLEELEA